MESILNQVYKDIEVLAINDGSTDSSVKILAGFDDERLRILNNDENKGLIYTLNRGINEARGKYIARMDADDIAYPRRLGLQVDFLESHPNVLLLGGCADVIDDRNIQFSHITVPASHSEIMQQILNGSCFIHPSVMFRTSAVKKLGGYRPQAIHAEDYDLWLRIIQKHKVANLPDTLIRYRVHPGQVSQRQLRQQRTSADHARLESYSYFKKNNISVPINSKIPSTVWHRLKGKSPSLGSDYLGWICRYREMGRNDLAKTLIIPGILSAPLCLKLYRQLLHPLLNCQYLQALLKRLRWYKKKLFAFFRVSHK
jgi:glycosyltransferase involved in cell wall biosynthesis